MNIAENILKHSLKNVYFLTGTPCGGKTTMATELSRKHGLIHFNDNWHEDNFKVWLSLCDEKYQKKAAARNTVADWEAYFGRSVEEFLADGDYNGYNEYLEFAVIELIKLSQSNKVIADISLPVKMAAELADYNRVACLLASPELVTCENYGRRDDHKEFLDCLMSLKEPEKKIAAQDALFKIQVERTFEDVRRHNLFSVVRTADSTIEDTAKILEKHFNL